ncbi:YitT family protein [Megasphaera vaginalis (ex Srinivasan et al. 2021)]|uniref:PF10035 family protein n=1 Tax=Megasphaera vaginalis (ex Srinivasan et al. 2021) TaxID=1111454 RepID=U7UJS3_9FIRM|nr:YitT family protein [Megasphaera vaginalis (ex Srinivasan et al. 2021)]ERT59657.1 PF10035 family protein [Megasphaera vaginalis (ex Srinivasan et al. 2021)]
MIAYLLRAVGLAFGALIYTIGLDVFLVPNHVIDGGVVGIALMAAHLTGISFSVFIVLLNIPFFVIGYHKIGVHFTLASLFAVLCLSLWNNFFHYDPLTADPFLSTIFGGIIIGLGVGLIIRWGGSLDGTEIMAIIADKHIPFSVGEIIMFFNLFILGSSGFVFSWDSAMYSLVAYFIAYKMIDVVTNGLDEMKGLFIVTSKNDEVSRCITRDLHRAVTLLYGEGAYNRQKTLILYCVVSRLEIMQLRNAVNRIDENAFISVFPIQEAQGGLFRRRSHP